MSPVKEMLIKKIKRMSDEEVRWMLEVAKQARAAKGMARSLRSLEKDPAIRIPKDLSGVFMDVEPIKGKGIPASKLLIRDRR